MRYRVNPRPRDPDFPFGVVDTKKVAMVKTFKSREAAEADAERRNKGDA